MRIRAEDVRIRKPFPNHAPTPLQVVPMTSVLRAAPVLLLFFALPAANAQSRMDADAPFSLDRYQWEHRVLLVFAPTAEHEGYGTQMALFEGEEAGFKDRDLVTIHVFGKGESHAEGEALSEADAEGLRERFDVGSGAFQVVLVGKDGTEKRRDRAPVRTSALFDEIDAMPMRQREMREQQDS